MRSPSTNAAYGALALAAVLWGGSIVAQKLALGSFSAVEASVLRDIGGLETNRINQLVVRPTLQTTLDEHVFAIGDCAACPWPEADHGKGGFVPPRAQAQRKTRTAAKVAAPGQTPPVAPAAAKAQKPVGPFEFLFK